MDRASNVHWNGVRIAALVLPAALASTFVCACARRSPTHEAPVPNVAASHAATATPSPLSPILAQDVATLRQCKGDASTSCYELRAHGRIGRVGSEHIRMIARERTSEIVTSVLDARHACSSGSPAQRTWLLKLGFDRMAYACGITGVDLTAECASGKPRGRKAAKKNSPHEPKRFSQIEFLIQHTTEADGYHGARELEAETGLLFGCERKGGSRRLSRERTDELIEKAKAEAYECAEPEGLHDSSIDSWSIIRPLRTESVCSTASVDLEAEFNRDSSDAH